MRLATILALALLGACAARSERAPAATEAAGGAAPATADTGGDSAGDAPMMQEPMDEETVQLMDEQTSLVDSLDSALRLANCNDAFGHRDAICDLTERICSIAEDEPRAIERCEDAQLRCASARERVSDECD